MKTLLAFVLIFVLFSVIFGQCPGPVCSGPKGSYCCPFTNGACCPSGVSCCPDYFICNAYDQCIMFLRNQTNTQI
ncbi:hypothetical protein L596_020960 [Steinernema carpocapsae]|uniref:Granulins domain-containing protein n=1 Tax=Steinernema carpocapsae TaxID=34508 RepID=A0A4V6A152_STECR|nr:hypothetical protein L596_020960 [Steinernema carpocapsae]